MRESKPKPVPRYQNRPDTIDVNFVPTMPTEKAPSKVRQRRNQTSKAGRLATDKDYSEQGKCKKMYSTTEIQKEVSDLRHLVLPEAALQSWDKPWLENLVIPLANRALKTLETCPDHTKAKGELELLRIFLFYLGTKNKSTTPTVTVNVNQEKTPPVTLSDFLGVSQDNVVDVNIEDVKKDNE